MTTNTMPEPDGKPENTQDSAGCAPMPGSEVALEIVLRGGPHAGKSEVARIITEALKAKGINVECYMAKRKKYSQYRPCPPQQPADIPYDGRRVVMLEEWGTRIPNYPQNDKGLATQPAPQMPEKHK